MAQLFDIAFTIIAGVIAIITGALVLWDFWVTRTIRQAERETIPIRIRKPLSYSQFLIAMEKMYRILDESRFVPDLVVGVHYQGLSFAALLAKLLYRPIRIAEVVYATDAKREGDRVIFDFDPGSFLRGKNVLIVDNSMQTGRTLRMVYDEVARYALNARTLVIYKKAGAARSEITPDFVLFYSVEPLRFLR